MTIFVLICIAGIALGASCSAHASTAFFGVALSWIALSPLVPDIIYFHASGIVATIAITAMSFFPSRAAERLVYCCLCCVILNAVDFVLLNTNSDIYNQTPIAYLAVYIAALLITIGEFRRDGFNKYWSVLFPSDFLAGNKGG